MAKNAKFNTYLLFNSQKHSKINSHDLNFLNENEIKVCFLNMDKNVQSYACMIGKKKYISMCIHI